MQRNSRAYLWDAEFTIIGEAVLALSHKAQHPVKAPLGDDIKALVRQDRHDLPGG